MSSFSRKRSKKRSTLGACWRPSRTRRRSRAMLGACDFVNNKHDTRTINQPPVMDPDFVYHETIQQGNRRRARSLLQDIATDNTDQQQSKKNEELIPPTIVPRIPADAEVPRRRAFSATIQRPKLEALEPLPGLYTLAPLTRKECDKLVQEQLGECEEDEEDVEEDELMDEFDEIDMANIHKYISFKDTAHFYSRSCTKLLERSKTITATLETLAHGFEHVRLETTSFEQTCDSLISEYDHLSELLSNVDRNLEFFTRLDKATRILHAPGSDLVTKQSFKPLLKDLDEGLQYVQEHDTFRDIDLYQMRYRQCMTRALTLAQSYFNTQIRNVTSHIQQQISAKKLNTTTQSALLYSRFETDAERLKPITGEISSRCEDHPEYYGLFSECLNNFFSARQRLLAPVIPKNFDESGANQDLIQFTRFCLSFYKQLCHDERTLFDKFFIHGQAEADEWLVTLCEPLYDSLRRRIIRETDVNNLCELTSILLSYETDDSIEVEQTLVNYSVLFQPILQDVQSRLVFRVQTLVDSEIVRYVPKPEDLSLGHRRESKTETSTEEQTAEFDTEQLFKGWYPPMRRSIMLLSQIYQLVNSAVFDDLAHRILHECLVSLTNARQLASSRLGELEGQLFLIKHLLLLSQQITGFDIDSIPAETAIDFSGLQETFTRVRQGGVSFTGSNLLNLARESVPRVVNNMLDAKEELYAKLKNSIHDFTEAAVKSIVKPIIDQPEPENAVEATRKLRQDAADELPRIRSMIGTYIDDERTIDILIDSIQDLVVQTYERYQEQVLSKASDPNQLDGIMEVDGLVSWLGDIVGKLHS